MKIKDMIKLKGLKKRYNQFEKKTTKVVHDIGEIDITDNKNLTINSGTGDITLVNIHGDGSGGSNESPISFNFTTDAVAANCNVDKV